MPGLAVLFPGSRCARCGAAVGVLEGDGWGYLTELVDWIRVGPAIVAARPHECRPGDGPRRGPMRFELDKERAQ